MFVWFILCLRRGHIEYNPIREFDRTSVDGFVSAMQHLRASHSLAMIRWLRVLQYILFPILLFGAASSLTLLIHISNDGIIVNGC